MNPFSLSLMQFGQAFSQSALGHSDCGFCNCCRIFSSAFYKKGQGYAFACL